MDKELTKISNPRLLAANQVGNTKKPPNFRSKSERNLLTVEWFRNIIGFSTSYGQRDMWYLVAWWVRCGSCRWCLPSFEMAFFDGLCGHNLRHCCELENGENEKKKDEDEKYKYGIFIGDILLNEVCFALVCFKCLLYGVIGKLNVLWSFAFAFRKTGFVIVFALLSFLLRSPEEL